MDILEYNRESWNRLVEKDDVLTRPVDEAVIAAAREGEWHVKGWEAKPVNQLSSE